MKRWQVQVWMLVFSLCVATPAMAGGIDNKQNFSAAYAGTLSRNAATDAADAAAYNPAGLIFLENGFTLELNAQPFTFDYDHNYNGQTKTASPFLVTPTAFGIYKSDKWAAFGSFTINGGGGQTEYDTGNIITEGIGNAAAAGSFTNAGYTAYEARTGTTRPNSSQLAPLGTLTNEYAFAESYDYTFTAGGSYKINDIFSVSAAGRYIFTDKEVDIRGTYSGTNIVGKYGQEADGFGGLFGLNIRPNEMLNIGIRYETKVKLDWETTVDSATRGTAAENILWMNGRVHGQSYARDLPAVLGVGIEWRPIPQLGISPSWTLYFEKDADWGTQNGKVDDNSQDIGISLQYDISPTWSVTAGYMFIDIGIKPDNYSIIEQMSPPLDCHALALGTKFSMGGKWRMTLGLTGYFYEADTAQTTYIAPGVVKTPTVTYDKVLYSGAIGISYLFN